jgi:hypothetical protein
MANYLTSGIIDPENVVAAMEMAGMKVWAHLLQRVWIHRQSFKHPNIISIL